MNTKEVKIEVPEGYEIDKENSTFECVKFKKKHLNFFKIRDSYDTETMNVTVPYNSNNYQKKLNAINKLMFVAKYLNDGWVPDFSSKDGSYKYGFYIYKNQVQIECRATLCSHIVYFASEELAQQAIEILGEETIKQALNNNY